MPSVFKNAPDHSPMRGGVDIFRPILLSALLVVSSVAHAGNDILKAADVLTYK